MKKQKKMFFFSTINNNRGSHFLLNTFDSNFCVVGLYIMKMIKCNTNMCVFTFAPQSANILITN